MAQTSKQAFLGKPQALGLILLLLTVAAHASQWLKLAPGVEYQDLNRGLFSNWSHVHVFRIDLKKNRLESLLAREFGQELAFADEFLKQSGALLSLNGGFFDQRNHPLGLRLSEYRSKSPLKPISWWSLFYIKQGVPYIRHRAPTDMTKVRFAIQAGPRLIIHGKIPRLRDGLAERSALGITSDQQLIILVSENKPMSTTELAKLMQAPPLNCKEALNLDGGSSSQIRADFSNFQLNAPGFSRVSDAILLRRK